MKKTLSALTLAIVVSSCYTIKANEQHHVVQYTTKQHGIKMLVTENYTRIITIDTLKTK